MPRLSLGLGPVYNDIAPPLKRELWYRLPNNALGTATPVLGQLLLFPFYVPSTMALNRVGYETMAAAAGTFSHAYCYEDNGNFQPGKMLHDFGSTDNGPAGNTIISGYWRFKRGWVWLGVMAESGVSPNFRTISPVGLRPSIGMDSAPNVGQNVHAYMIDAAVAGIPADATGLITPTGTGAVTMFGRVA